MAPILKEVEAPVATTTTSASAPPHSKPANEAPARPQPVALEIPVTVNGARTVDGSDKRVPFSEATQTVLVFPHGAVIRIATPLTSGQLVFLTNEKTKKEVVCQVVKSKSTGTAAAYVELQFTEASAGFWGLQIPGSSAAPVAPRPAAPVAPKAPAPTAPAATKPMVVASKPVAPAAISTPPVKPAVPAPTPTVVHSTTAAPYSPAVTSSSPIPPASVVAPPPPVASISHTVPVPEPVKPVAPVDAPHVAAVPTQPTTPPQAHAIPVPPVHDYSKEISALFAVPQAPAAPATPEPHPASVPPEPSTEELRLQAARLQAQLSSLLFTEAPSASPAAPASKSAPKPEAPVAEVAKKVLDIAQQQVAKPVVHSEPKPFLPARKPAPAALGVDEEVKIPSWLAPLSQNSESTVADSTVSKEAAAADHFVSVNSEESYDALVADAPRRPQTAVFGGQLLGESTASVVEGSSSGAKKGLYFGLAAAALLLAAGAWYYHETFSRPTSV